MSRLEAEQEITSQTRKSGDADLLIGIVAPAGEELILSSSATAIESLRTAMPSLRCAVAYPGILTDQFSESVDGSPLRAIPYPASPLEPPLFPWIGRISAYRSLEAIALDLKATACVIVGPDLAAMDATAIHLLAGPVVENQCDLSMPLYAAGKFEGLLNSSILSPLTRALYGKRVRFPLAPDFALSLRMLKHLANPSSSASGPAASTLLWPTVEAVRSEQNICQTFLKTHHESQNEGVDLSSVLGGLLGSLFSDMEKNASIWQRIRGSQALPLSGGEKVSWPVAEEAIDVRPLLDSFHLGARNLQEVWSLVLPPVTLLELKHLLLRSSEQFRIPDDLWVRIVYDFALAHRLRNISRVHILGAFTPLYLGWVASHVMQVANDDAERAEQRLESLAQAYEDGKPYLLSRWRWPDRFNP